MNRCAWAITLNTLSIYAGRTVHRLVAEELPSISVCNSSDAVSHRLIDCNLRPVPLLAVFDLQHFTDHLLPQETIMCNDGTIIETARLDQRINELLDEINKKNKVYTHFDILKQSGFVRAKKCGLLIVKFKEEEKLPFVVKLFIEPPQGFVHPYDKGFEAANFFIAGGALRHTLGFSRIKTLEYIQTKIERDSYWHDKIITPRKWFWLPKNPEWLEITTHNLGRYTQDHIRMPAVYALVADELKKDPIKNTDYAELMRLSRFLEYRIDPHTKNFFIEQATGKIAIIDTELFPLILGFSTPITPKDSYIKWYTYLAGKYLKEKLFSTKTARIERRFKLSHYYVEPSAPLAPSLVLAPT